MDQKRLLLAIAVSIAILLGFQFLVPPHLPHPPAPPPAKVASNQATPGQNAATPGRRARPVPRRPDGRSRPCRRTCRALKIAAPRLRGSISLLGARIDDLVLTDYRETLDPNFAAGPPAGAAVGLAALLRAVRLDRRPPGEQVQAAGQRHAVDGVGRHAQRRHIR